jgi:glycosyltransferase involved in cell wall biosynthesis
MPTVSVITPAYNAAAYLTASVESVLRQTLADLELLIVDDGSTDATVALARQLAAADPRVRVLTQPNAGPGPARNTGIRHATGRYFAFIDSDDEWDRTFLAEQVEILEARPDVDVLIANARNRGGERDRQPTRPVQGAVGERISLGDMLADESALFIMTVFRREVIDKVGGFDPALLTNEEYDLWIRAALAGLSFARNPTPLGWYTCRPGSLSSQDARMHSGILRVLAKTRPRLAPGSKELAILDSKAGEFAAELAAIEARRALRDRDYRTAADRLAELAARRPGLATRAAALLVAWAPPIGGAAYRLSNRVRTTYRHSRGSANTAAVLVRQLRRMARTVTTIVDASLRAWSGRRQVLLYVRNAMHAGVLEPPCGERGLRSRRAEPIPRATHQGACRSEPLMKFSVVIATYNRAGELADTLSSLAGLQSPHAWEVIVVDNNSPDETRAVVERAAATFPVRLTYAFEPVQGRSAALNHGFSLAAGEIIVTTDDDVRVPADWLTAMERGLEAHRCDYVGGRVLPLWGAPRPNWIPNRGGHMWAVIALLDFGPSPLRFGTRVPLGVNMAFRRAVLDRVGGFNPRIGRKAGTLLGQEVREWCLRAHALDARGWYLPDMVVEHRIPADRLQKSYFRRWFYWRGISRAMLYADTGRDMQQPEQSTLDFTKVAHIAGVPRYLFRSAAVTLREMLRAAWRRDAAAQFEHEAQLCFFVGIFAQRWKDRHRPVPQAVGQTIAGAARPAPASVDGGPTATALRQARTQQGAESASTHQMARPHAANLIAVIIPTYNRAARLAETLDRLAQTRCHVPNWEVIVVDNNSSDDTRAVVESRAARFPVRLRYVFEGTQGRSQALNTGIAACSAQVLVFTDDDVLVADGWLDAATAPLLAAGDIEYTGGPVRPLWEAPRPEWLSPDKSDLWGTIAILDYGDQSFVFEERRRVPLGANMAARRTLFDRIGLFSSRLGRTGRRLLGQEVPELLARARAAGARGLYVPTMIVDHHVPASRLQKAYFRRWWYGKGISRAELDRLQPVNELGVDLSRAKQVFGLPRFMVRMALTDLVGWIVCGVTLNRAEQFKHEAMLCYFAGYTAARRQSMRSLRPAVAR